MVNYEGKLSLKISQGYQFFISIWEACKAIEFPIVPIRKRSFDYETAISGGDYDYLMPAFSYPVFVQILHIQAYKFNASFSINSSNPNKIQIIIHLPELLKNIHIEIWTELEIKDPLKRFSRFIPWSNIQDILIKENGEFKFPIEFEATYYLSHLYTRKKNLENIEVEKRIFYYSQEVKHIAELTGLFDSLHKSGVCDCALKANEILFKMGYIIKVGFIGRMYRDFLYFIEKSDIRANRSNLRKASIITFTGSDGVGKTTVMNSWQMKHNKYKIIRFKNLFRHHPFYKPIAFYFKTINNSEKSLEKNIFDEKHGSKFYYLAKNSWALIKLLSIFGQKFLVDRSFSDLLFKDIRSSDSNHFLVDNWQNLAAKTPLVNWHIHLDAPNDVIFSRKKEISESSLVFYRHNMSLIVSIASVNAYSRIDTSNSIEVVLKCIELAGKSLGVQTCIEVNE